MALYISKTKIGTDFDINLDDGLFTMLPIPEGSAVILYDSEERTKINDPKADISKILNAKNDEEFYSGFVHFRNKYLNSEIEVNLKKVRLLDQDVLIASRNIEKDEELTREYGIVGWITELLRIVNKNTIHGYKKILDEYEDEPELEESIEITNINLEFF